MPTPWTPRNQGRSVDNTGTGATQAITLPAAVVGLEYHGIRYATQAMHFIPHSGEQILGASAVDKYLSLDSDGASVHLKCLNDGVWQVISSFGTTSFET